jgi:hypothetical protein
LLILRDQLGKGTLTREGSWWQQPIHLIGLSHIHTASLRNLLKLRTLVEGTAQTSLPNSRASYVTLFVLSLKYCPGLAERGSEEEAKCCISQLSLQ